MGKKQKKGGAAGGGKKKNTKRFKMEEADTVMVEGIPLCEGEMPELEDEEVTPEPQPGTSRGTLEEEPVPVNPNSRLFTLEHPMLNPMLIMKVISFYNPDIEDFKILRQVCKCWYSVTFDLWRKRFILRLTEEPEVFRERKGGGLSVGEFLRRFSDPEDPYQLSTQPYTKYTFLELTIDMNICDTPGTECKRFWDNVGPLMEYLHFNRCFFLTGQYMAFEQLILEKVPNLKALAITDTGKVALPSVSNESPYIQRQKSLERIVMMKEKLLEDHQNLKSLRIYGGIPLKLRKLVGKLPYLEDLRIRNSVHTTATYDDVIMDLLIFLRKQRLQSNHAKYTLKHLDLMHTRAFYSWFSISRVLSNVNFPLETLSVEIKPDQSLNHQALKPLLEHHAGTLKSLKVFCPPLSNTNYHDNFPFDINLEHLEEMQLWGNCVRSFKFLKFMPNLKRVLINRHCIEKWEEVIMQQKEVSHLGWFHPNQRTYILPFQEDMVQKAEQDCDMSMVTASQLEVLRVDYRFSPESLRRLGEWCPNIKTLWTVVNGENIGAICNAWPELRNLIAMFQSELDDGAITGWRFEGEEKMERREGGCLRDLKDLRRFQYDTLCSQSKLTDKAGLHGLMEMGRLDAVQICVGPKFAPETEAKLKRHIPLVRVIRNYGKKPHCDSTENGTGAHVGICCFHKKFFETIRSDEDEHTRRQNALQRARERRRVRQGQVVQAMLGAAAGGNAGGARNQGQQADLDFMLSSSDSDSSSSSSSSSSDDSEDEVEGGNNEGEESSSSSSDDEGEGLGGIMPHLERFDDFNARD